jgi:hypothetical protein
MKTYLYLKLLIIILLTGYGPEIDKITEPSIIPKPLSQKSGNGYFIFDNDVAIVSEPILQESLIVLWFSFWGAEKRVSYSTVYTVSYAHWDYQKQRIKTNKSRVVNSHIVNKT